MKVEIDNSSKKRRDLIALNTRIHVTTETGIRSNQMTLAPIESELSRLVVMPSTLSKYAAIAMKEVTRAAINVSRRRMCLDMFLILAGNQNHNVLIARL
jgi:hypothetical protein